MRKFIVSSTSLAGLLLAGAALAGGPVNPPPASCGPFSLFFFPRESKLARRLGRGFGGGLAGLKEER